MNVVKCDTDEMCTQEVCDDLLAANSKVTSSALVEKRSKTFIDPAVGKFAYICIAENAQCPSCCLTEKEASVSMRKFPRTALKTSTREFWKPFAAVSLCDSFLCLFLSSADFAVSRVSRRADHTTPSFSHAYNWNTSNFCEVTWLTLCRVSSRLRCGTGESRVTACSVSTEGVSAAVGGEGGGGKDYTTQQWRLSSPHPLLAFFCALLNLQASG